MTPVRPVVPINFLIGSASAALQIEGGDLETNWHEWAATPGNIADGSTPARASDHWNRWEQDNLAEAHCRAYLEIHEIHDRYATGYTSATGVTPLGATT